MMAITTSNSIKVKPLGQDRVRQPPGRTRQPTRLLHRLWLVSNCFTECLQLSLHPPNRLVNQKRRCRSMP